MQRNTISTKVFGSKCTLTLMEFEKEDGKEWKRIFDLWKGLKVGMREYQSREPNFPEGLSEVAFCLWSGSSRLLSATGGVNTSFDTFNTKNKKAEQIKACSIDNDLTSFGPKSKWDDLYFLDFYAGGNVDGTFDVYKISNKLIYGHKVNAKQTVADQQQLGRRPRFSIKKELIVRRNIKPVAKKVRVW